MSSIETFELSISAKNKWPLGNALFSSKRDSMRNKEIIELVRALARNQAAIDHQEAIKYETRSNLR